MLDFAYNICCHYIYELCNTIITGYIGLLDWIRKKKQSEFFAVDHNDQMFV